MIFNLQDFKIETIYIPNTNIQIFKNLQIENEKIFTSVTKDLFELIDLIEIMRAFTNNKLDTNKEYHLNNIFKAKFVQQDKKYYLAIQFVKTEKIFFFDKIETAIYVAKFSKIIQRCEAYQA